MTVCSSCGERQALHRHDLCAECDDTLSDEEFYEKHGEPRGAGVDPYGRPDPRTHPEYWTE